ncbi:MAG: GAF domain-containing protein, partial [Oxalobacteraceae bacterium]
MAAPETELLLRLQTTVLEAVARGERLADIGAVLCHCVERSAPGVISSVLLVDDDARLQTLAAPSLPQSYCNAINGLAIGPKVGSCGTAAWRNQPVEVRDIATDPLWAKFKQLALPLGLRACWSSPIRDKNGRVLGTFAFYYRDARGPTAFE